MTRKVAEKLWVNPRCVRGSGRALRPSRASSRQPRSPLRRRALKKKVMPCYSEMLTLMTCFKARGAAREAAAAVQPLCPDALAPAAEQL